MTQDDFDNWLIDQDLPREYEALAAENPGKPVLFYDLVRRVKQKLYRNPSVCISPDLELLIKQHVRWRLNEHRKGKRP